MSTMNQKILRAWAGVSLEKVPLGDRWTGGKMVLHAGDTSVQPKEIPIETFFHKSISKFPTSQALDIADFFRVPFPIILKRALQLDIITDEQYRNFMTVSLKPAVKSRPLFVSKSGELEGDFEQDQLYKEF